MTKNEKFINRNSKNQKKIENFWDQKFRVRHARYRISTSGTRCNRLNFFEVRLYIKNFMFQNWRIFFLGRGEGVKEYVGTMISTIEGQVSPLPTQNVYQYYSYYHK